MPIYLGDTLIFSDGGSEYDLYHDEIGMVVSPNNVMYPMEACWHQWVNSISPSGSIADLPSDIKYIYSSIGMTGDLSDIPESAVGVYIQSSDITGDVGEDIPASVTHINLYNCPAITCDLADLSSALTHLNLASNPLVAGVYTPGAGIQSIILDSTGMSDSDTDATLIALDACGAENGTGSMCPNRTSASDAAVASLISKGWMLMLA